MAHDVKPRFTAFLPGSGFDSGGNPVQGKTRVVGLIDVTSSSGSAGESLDAIDVGLITIDAITLRPVDEVPGTSGGTVKREAVYSATTETFYLVEIDGAGARTFVTSGTAVPVEFVADGDGSGNVELT